ncbi:MAG: PatB family C-S lyase [Bacteroidota bacterium]|nr:PatB family C-S lyase [Bacteroidota bacterium]
MNNNFDEFIERKGTDSIKYDKAKAVFGNDDILPMWVADMDFPAADFIINDIKKRIDHPILGYTMRSKAFNSSFKNWAKRRYNWDIKMGWLDFSPGVVTGLAVSLLALTKQNDKIIIQPPVYHPFFETVLGNERILVENPLKKNKEGKFEIDFKNLEQIIDVDTKAIIFSNPHNPVGRVWAKDELQKLADIAIKHDLIILSDDIHADFVFKGYEYTPIASLSEEIAERTITIMSPSKTFNIAGLSTSIVVIQNEEIKEKYNQKLAGMHLFLGNVFGSVAFESAYSKGDEWLNELLVYLEENTDLVVDYISKNIPKIKIWKPEGTFLLWLDFSETGFSHNEIKQKLINDAKLGFNDGETFGSNGSFFFRMNIGTQKENVKIALEKLKNVFG